MPTQSHLPFQCTQLPIRAAQTQLLVTYTPSHSRNLYGTYLLVEYIANRADATKGL